MTRKMADLLGLKRGDTVLMRPIKGLRQTREVPVSKSPTATSGWGSMPISITSAA